VPADRSRAEIEAVLKKFGATGFAYGWADRQGIARIEFELEGRRIRFTLTLPDPDDHQFARDAAGRRRSSQACEAAYQQEVRRLWRSVLLVVKAKLEAVRSGIVSMEEEFLAHIVLPDSSTVGEWAAAQLKEVYSGGRMPALLPGSGDR
jgi:hypothetical protein